MVVMKKLGDMRMRYIGGEVKAGVSGFEMLEWWVGGLNAGE